MTDRLELKHAVLQVVAKNDGNGLTVDEIVRAAKLLPCCEPVTRDDVASVLRALVRAGRLKMHGGPREGGGGYRYSPAECGEQRV